MKNKVLGGFVVLLVVAVSFAYAAANTVPVTGAGDGQAVISGYNVTGVHYVLNTTNPSTIASVEFSLAPIESGADDPETVSIQLVSNGSWYPCTASGTTWSCTIGGVDVYDADELRVVAAQ